MNPPPPTWVALAAVGLCVPIYGVSGTGRQFILLSMLCMFLTFSSWSLFHHLL